jgi:hypothetical protein
MTNNKKIENEQIEETIQEVVEPIGEIKLSEPKKMEQCEWCFQFDDDEPKVFAWTNEDMKDEEPTVTFTISNTKDLILKRDKSIKEYEILDKITCDINPTASTSQGGRKIRKTKKGRKTKKSKTRRSKKTK